MRNESSVWPAPWKLGSAGWVLTLVCLLCLSSPRRRSRHNQRLRPGPGRRRCPRRHCHGGVSRAAIVSLRADQRDGVLRCAGPAPRPLSDSRRVVRVRDARCRKTSRSRRARTYASTSRLRVGGLAEQVDVAARATMLETRSAAQSNLIDGQRVQDLPMNGRNVVALAGTYAGVTAIRASQDTSDGRQGPIMSVNGGNTNHNLFTLNGAIFTHFNQTTGFNPPPPDAIQEIRIQTHNFSAEYGHTAGSQVSIVSKSGTNAFHGTAWEFHRNSALNARSFFQTTQARAEAEPDRRKRRRRDHSQQGVLVRRLSAALGSIGSRTEPDHRSNRRAARRRLHGAQHPAAESRRTRSPLRRSPTAPARPCVSGNIIRAGLHQPGFTGPAEHVRSRVGDRYGGHADAGAAGSRGLHGARRLPSLGGKPVRTAISSRTAATVRPGPAIVNYVQQGVFSDVNQFGLSDTHIFHTRFVNEATFSYLTSRSGGGALTQIAPRDQGVNVDVGNDGRGMSYTVSGSINLNYPGVNAQDYVSWQFKDTMTYNVGNHTLKWGYEFIRPIFEFNLALTAFWPASPVREPGMRSRIS